jgi:Fur family ferric uptake transcriptional regulator
MMSEAEHILRECGLNITVQRVHVLNVFLGNSMILHHADLMALCDKSINRITMYRILQTFYERHILIKVPSSNGIAQYIYRGTKGSEIIQKKKAPESHIHLICQKCGKIISPEDLRFPRIDLPKGFDPTFMDLIVNGLCSSCSEHQ